MSNSWWEILVLCDPALDDLVFWRLETFGCRGTASEAKSNLQLLKAYLPEAQMQLLDLAALSLLIRQDALSVGLSSPVVQWNLVEDEDWSSSWKQHWQPQKVGDLFLVNPAWLPIPQDTDRHVLRLDPGLAFGTGTHATTQLCLEALEMRLGLRLPASVFTDQAEADAPATIADIGCGSGILSIAAALLGAQQVYALDTDLIAVKATQSNCKLNQLQPKQVMAHQGSIEQLAMLIKEPVDGFVCNILAEVIIDMIPKYMAISKPSTWGIISGILLDQVKPIAATLEQNGWIVATLWRRQEWCCLNIRRA